MVMEGAEEKQAGRLWDKFDVKELVKEKCDTLYLLDARSSSQGNGMCLSRAGRYPGFEWWDTTPAPNDVTTRRPLHHSHHQTPC